MVGAGLKPAPTLSLFSYHFDLNVYYYIVVESYRNLVHSQGLNRRVKFDVLFRNIKPRSGEGVGYVLRCYRTEEPVLFANLDGNDTGDSLKTARQAFGFGSCLVLFSFSPFSNGFYISYKDYLHF